MDAPIIANIALHEQWRLATWHTYFILVSSSNCIYCTLMHETPGNKLPLGPQWPQQPHQPGTPPRAPQGIPQPETGIDPAVPSIAAEESDFTLTAPQHAQHQRRPAGAPDAAVQPVRAAAAEQPDTSDTPPASHDKETALPTPAAEPHIAAPADIQPLKADDKPKATPEAPVPPATAPSVEQPPAPAESTAEGAAKPSAEKAEAPVAPDTELADMRTKADEAIGWENVSKLLASNTRFSEWQAEDSRLDHPDKALLRELPKLVKTATEAGLSGDEVAELAVYAMDKLLYDYTYDGGHVASHLQKALEPSAADGKPLDEGAVDKLKAMIDMAAPDDGITKSLSAYEASRLAGLPPADSADIVMEFLQKTDREQISIETFGDAMRTLADADVSPNLVKEMFHRLSETGSSRPVSAYRQFEEAVTFVGPKQGYSPQETILQLLLQEVRGADPTQPADVLGRLEPRFSRIAPIATKEEYFAPREGTLKHSALVCRTARSLEEGVDDLHQLALADENRGEHVALGKWVFDPTDSVWYNMGGRTEVDFDHPETSRHRTVNYSIGKISEQPVVFHVRPRQVIGNFAAMIPDPAIYRELAGMTRSHDLVTTPRLFIAHEMGTTEVKHTGDAGSIEDAAREMHFLLPDILRMETLKAGAAAETEAEKATAAQTFLASINRFMPPGFELILHPPGTDLSEAIGREAS